MTPDSLNRGNKIIDILRELYEARKFIGEANGFYDNHIFFSNNRGSRLGIKSHFDNTPVIDLEIVKTIMLATIEKKITELEEEFKSL